MTDEEQIEWEEFGEYAAEAGYLGERGRGPILIRQPDQFTGPPRAGFFLPDTLVLYFSIYINIQSYTAAGTAAQPSTFTE